MSREAYRYACSSNSTKGINGFELSVNESAPVCNECRTCCRYIALYNAQILIGAASVPRKTLSTPAPHSPLPIDDVKSEKSAWPENSTLTCNGAKKIDCASCNRACFTLACPGTSAPNCYFRGPCCSDPLLSNACNGLVSPRCHHSKLCKYWWSFSLCLDYNALLWQCS